MKKVLIYGIGTYKNRGVEAIVNSTLNQISDDYKVSIACLDYDNNKTKYQKKVSKYIRHISATSKVEQTYTTDREILRNIQKELIDEVPKYDICLSAGGDNYSYNANDWLFTIDEEVKKNNKKLVLWGASILEKIDDERLLNDLNKFDVIYVRESITYDAIAKYVDLDKVLLGPDPAFALKKKEVKLNSFYKNKKVVGINLSPFIINENNKDAFDAVIDLINYILKETDYSVSLIPHVIQKESNDMKIHKKLKAKFKNEDRVFLEDDNYDCEEIKYIISQCDIFIASRTHASIAAYSTCVPTLVLGYSVKSKGIAKDLFGTNHNYVLPYDKINTSRLINNFKWLKENQNDIKKVLKAKIPTIIKEASTMFTRTIDLLEENAKKTICDSRECIGCGLCKNVCPTQAISWKKNDEGFYYPKINLQKCINCDLCRQKCPVANKFINQRKKEIQECYACKSKDNELRKDSSSGAFFPVLAKSFIEELDGVVYGATNHNNKTKHIRVSKVEDLFKIRGAKYTQSDLNDVYKLLKEDIKNNKHILFSGTACQIAAIKRYSGNYDKLYTAAVICHGVMNDDIVSSLLKEKSYSSETEVLYHKKDVSWDNPTVILKKDGEETSISYGNSDLMTLYLDNTILRNSCYECNYKGSNNIADVIMGDYWGINNKHPDIYDKDGVSSVVLNTSKAKKLIKKLSLMDNFIFKESTYKDILDGNSMLEQSAKNNIDRYHLSEYMSKQSLELLAAKHKVERKLKQESLEKENLININKQIQQAILEVDNRLNDILNSNRWKLVNKTFDKVNRLLRRNK